VNGGQGVRQQTSTTALPKQAERTHFMDTNPSLEPGQPPLIEHPARPKFRLSRTFWIGLILFILGSGPLLTVILLAWLGATKDPNPNPVGFGILAFLTFWPSVILVIFLVVTTATPTRHFMFSRYDREALVEVINRYLSDELTAFKLDDALSDIAARTKDETVNHVADLFWYHYDDVEDHKVVASKEQWDFFQRLLLILKKMESREPLISRLEPGTIP
jgi:hypothetical protein